MTPKPNPQPDLFTPPPPKWGWSYRHDKALDWCIAQFGRCTFNCAKDGAPNCWHWVAENACYPAQVTL